MSNSGLFRPREYFRPKGLDKAVKILQQYRGTSAILAGGTDFLVNKPSGIECLVDITRLPLKYIKNDQRDIRIGALTTLRELEISEELTNEPYSIIPETAHKIGTFLTKHIATVGGNICSSIPSADMPPSLIALSAKAIIYGTESKKEITLEDFFTGPKSNVLKGDEILIEIMIPKQTGQTKAVFLKKGRTHEDIAQVNVASAVTAKDGICEDVRIVLGAVAPTPLRVKKAENLLIGKEMEDSLIEKVASVSSKETRCIGDIRCSKSYRQELSKILVKRSLEKIRKKFEG